MLQLAEGVQDGGRGDGCHAVDGEHLEELVHALPDNLGGLLLVDAVVLHEAGLYLLGELGHVVADGFHPGLGDAGRRHVRLGVHPGGSWERPGVLRGAVRERVAGLLRHADQGLVGPCDGHIESIPRLLLRSGADDERIVLSGHAEALPQSIHELLGDTIVGKLVGMEYPLDAAGAGPLSHLGAQAEPALIAVHHAGESGQTDRQDASLGGQRALDDLGIALLEDVGDILGDELHRDGAPVVEDALDADEHLLPVDLVPDVVGD